MSYELFARDGSKGQRRDYRRFVRNTLGTSRDAAPTVHETLCAAKYLSELLTLASSGRYALTIKRRNNDGTTDHVTPREALDHVKAAREARLGL